MASDQLRTLRARRLHHHYTNQLSISRACQLQRYHAHHPNASVFPLKPSPDEVEYPKNSATDPALPAFHSTRTKPSGIQEISRPRPAGNQELLTDRVCPSLEGDSDLIIKRYMDRLSYHLHGAVDAKIGMHHEIIKRQAAILKAQRH
ncbi:hypothetical protein NM208_g3242 [Fusarium decemcellulare]|uniref:Uncharacterized protein n=1 Tax=Fusarium decemcellulare TaxID=57161 RepID=A0ACC1SPZ4_9HYPO|nr:hypothetical protein NM208_g3242 [Fusarium decemcellulare]